MKKGFIDLITIIIAAAVAIASAGFYTYKIKQAINQANQVKLGATILETQLADTIGTFRTNVNDSLTNINSALSDSTSTDPGHKHSSSSLDLANDSVPAAKIGTSSARDFVTGSTQTWAGVKDFSSIPTTISTSPTLGNQLVTKTYADSVSTKLPALYAFEALLAGDVVGIGDGTASSTSLAVNQANESQEPFGGVTAKRVEQTFKVYATTTVNVIQAAFALNGSPTDSISVTLRQSQDGTSLSSGTIAYNAINSTQYSDVTMSPAYILSPGTTYRLEFYRTGAEDNTNKYFLQVQATGSYADGQISTGSPGSWTPGADDAGIKIMRIAPVSQLFRASSWDLKMASTTAGITTEAVSASSTTQISIIGSQSGYTGLTVASGVYVSSTPGQIWTGSTGSSTKQVGLSITSSTISIRIGN